MKNETPRGYATLGVQEPNCVELVENETRVKVPFHHVTETELKLLLQTFSENVMRKWEDSVCEKLNAI